MKFFEIYYSTYIIVRKLSPWLQCFIRQPANRWIYLSLYDIFAIVRMVLQPTSKCIFSSSHHLMFNRFSAIFLGFQTSVRFVRFRVLCFVLYIVQVNNWFRLIHFILRVDVSTNIMDHQLTNGCFYHQYLSIRWYGVIVSKEQFHFLYQFSVNTHISMRWLCSGTASLTKVAKVNTLS